MLVIFTIKFKKKKKKQNQDKLDPFLQAALLSPAGDLLFGR